MINVMTILKNPFKTMSRNPFSAELSVSVFFLYVVSQVGQTSSSSFVFYVVAVVFSILPFVISTRQQEKKRPLRWFDQRERQ